MCLCRVGTTDAAVVVQDISILLKYHKVNIFNFLCLQKQEIYTFNVTLHTLNVFCLVFFLEISAEIVAFHG